MYRAKAHEGSAIEIFDADLQQQMIERVDVETALAAALIDPTGGLVLHYQPVLDATSGELVGVEALIRWDRPGHGLLPPDSFIPIAEATSLIIDLDCWVLAAATRQLVAWSAIAELAEVPVAVNISGRHLLSRHLAEHIRAVLDNTGIDPHRLSIEITETVLLADLASAAAELEVIRALGVRVAIDDFGTGYTSLAHLQQLPIDTIKIDRSFISQLNVRRGSSLVRMVTDLGHAIDINIVAEGVETSEEMEALQAMGADQLQGYLLSRPLEPAALSSWVTKRVVATASSE
jgi:EAL domain-containing protein (putative c-di-GMP-specific phosphodiesterase class I)